MASINFVFCSSFCDYRWPYSNESFFPSFPSSLLQKNVRLLKSVGIAEKLRGLPRLYTTYYNIACKYNHAQGKLVLSKENPLKPINVYSDPNERSPESN